MVLGYLFSANNFLYSTAHPISACSLDEEFADYLEKIICQEPLIIAGDFNLHVEDSTNNDALKSMDLLESFGLNGHILDLIITRSCDDILHDSTVF